MITNECILILTHIVGLIWGPEGIGTDMPE